MAVTITFLAINVNTLNRGAAVGVGENNQTGWAQNGKSNLGNGNLFGITAETNVVTTVMDNDIIDNPTLGIQNQAAAQNQML